MGLKSVPDQMLACQVVEYNKPYAVNTIPTPKDLGEKEMLIKVAVAGLCHTDSMVSAGLFGTKLPCTGSHEGAGTIVALGSAVTDFKVGDRIMAGIYKDFCGVCSDCQGPENFTQYCENNTGGIGVNIDGAFAEYCVIGSRTATKLPDKVSFETAAPLACAGCTVWRGVLQSKLVKGEWLAIVGGGGGLGHLGIQFAKALGLNVIGIDARDEGLALSRECGADLVIDARMGKSKVVEEIKKVTSGGADATLNVSDAKSAASTACAVTKRHGLMIQIAQPETVDIPFAELVFRDVRVQGSLISSRDEARRMLDVVAEHGISVKTNPVNGIRNVPKLVELAHGGKMAGKGIVIIDEATINAEKKDRVRSTI